ncbi:MAG: hypothetical protein U0792_04160 [Gemmataceae bacterium]
MSLLTRSEIAAPALPKSLSGAGSSRVHAAVSRCGLVARRPRRARHHRSWVYAAVNAIAQEAAKQRPFLYRNTGQAEHEMVALPCTRTRCAACSITRTRGSRRGNSGISRLCIWSDRERLLACRTAIGGRDAARHPG